MPELTLPRLAPMLSLEVTDTMTEDQKSSADQALEAALKATGASDPRSDHRQTIRGLRDANPEAYQAAVSYYQDVLVPSIASGEADPLKAWRDFGGRLAELTASGRTVEIDGTGRARPCTDDPPLDSLVVHLPEGRGSTRAILVSRPIQPTPAQEASYQLLVLGKQRLPG